MTLTKLILKLSIILFCLNIIPIISKGQQIIFQEGFENIKMQTPNFNNNDFHAESGSGFANLFSGADEGSSYIIKGIDISNGVAFVTFWYKQEVSSPDGNGLKVYFRNDSISSWNLLANYSNSIRDWEQETLFLPGNSKTYQVMFEGKGKNNDIILLDNIHVEFYKNATAIAVGSDIYIDTEFNVSSSLKKIKVSVNQISGLPLVSNSLLIPNLPVSCPTDAFNENEPDCSLNYKDITNAGCDTVPNNYTKLTGCNGVVCGKSGIFTYNGSVRRDIDWYKLISSGTSSVTLKVVADFNVRVYVINLIGDCDGVWLFPGYDLSTNAGDTSTIYIPNITYSSNLYFWIAPNFGQNVPCGSNYVMIYNTAPIITPSMPTTSSIPACTPTQLNPITNIPDYLFYWQNNSYGTSTINPANMPFPAATPGTYYVRGIYYPLSCWTSSRSIDVNSPPVISVNALPISVCQNDQSVLTANGATDFTWMPGNFTGNQVNVNPISSTIYTVTGTQAGCSSSSTTTVSVNPKYNFTENKYICKGDLYNWYGQEFYTSGTYFSNYYTKNGCDSIYSLHLTTIPLSRSLHLKLYLEGLYNNSGLMNQVQSFSGSQFGDDIADQITVELHDASSPYSTRFQESNIDLYTNGMLTVPNVPCNIGGLYYLVIKQHNSIETWSSVPVFFGDSSAINYDFSTSASQAYGNNLKHIGNIFAIWSGDVTNDGMVDGSDIAATDNASSVVLTGYFQEDVNGDGVVDGSDLATIDNNSKAIIQVIRP
jgi:hypothetical protein